MSEVKVKVSLQSGIQTGLTKIRGQFAEFRSELNSSFGNLLAFGAIAAGFGKIIAKGDKIGDLSRRFDAPTKELQRMGNVAELNGASMEDVAKAWNKLAVNQQKAIQGNDEARKSFADLGISMHDVVNLSIDQLFYRVADATKATEDRGLAYASTVALMGRNAGQLFSTLELGSAAIKQQGDAFGVMSDEDVQKIKAISDELKTLTNRIMVWGSHLFGWVKQLGESIGAIFGTVVSHVSDSLAGIGNALKLAASGHFIEAGKSLGQLMKDNFHAVFSLDKTSIFGELKDDLKEIWKSPTSPVALTDGKKVKDRTPDDSNSELSRKERILKLQEQLAEIQRRAANDQLTAEQKINALIAQRAALLDKAAKEQDPERKLELEIKAADVLREVIAAQKSLDKQPDDVVAAPKVVADQLQRIGGGGHAAVSGANENLREARVHTGMFKKMIELLGNKGEPAPLELKP